MRNYVMSSAKNRQQALRLHPVKCAICGRYENQPEKLVNHHINPVKRDKIKGLIIGDTSPDNSEFNCYKCHNRISHENEDNLLKSSRRQGKHKDNSTQDTPPRITCDKIRRFTVKGEKVIAFCSD
ncbi:MAG: hypothetical protein JW873_02890 [Candidatus Saganbacteria bacterium]|nr:hypothetical protein [Candidatus Saganbacteria bacterium]